MIVIKYIDTEQDGISVPGTITMKIPDDTNTGDIVEQFQGFLVLLGHARTNVNQENRWSEDE